MEELFEIQESLSPRLEWLRKWNIHTSTCLDDDGGTQWSAWFYPADKDPWDYMMGSASWMEDHKLIMFAKSQDECLTSIWNEWEGFEEDLTEYKFNKKQ